MEWDRQLRDKVAVVTGAGGGIGEAIARRFASHGAEVEIAEIDPERGPAVAHEIGASGGSARAEPVDVTDRDAVASWAEAVLARRGGGDVVVNNVGHYLEATPFRHSSPEHWDALQRVNFQHVLLVTHAFLPAMLERSAGSIVNVSSVEGLRGYPPDPVYAAQKAAVAHFTTSLAVELGRKGIRVNAIAPDLTQSLQCDFEAWVPEAERERFAIWAPLGGPAVADAPADVALFLASDQSRYVTGQTLPVDGGTRAAGGWYWSASRRRWTNRPEDP